MELDQHSLPQMCKRSDPDLRNKITWADRASWAKLAARDDPWSSVAWFQVHKGPCTDDNIIVAKNDVTSNKDGFFCYALMGKQHEWRAQDDQARRPQEIARSTKKKHAPQSDSCTTRSSWMRRSKVAVAEEFMTWLSYRHASLNLTVLSFGKILPCLIWVVRLD